MSKNELFYLSYMQCSIYFLKKFENINFLIPKTWFEEWNERFYYFV